MIELRCGHTILHGILVSPHVLEVKCRCKSARDAGVVMLHRFDTRTGQLITTLEFKEPGK